MSTSTLIVSAVIGLLAGWFASLLMRGKGLGLAGNLVLGVVGAFVGSYLLGLIGVSFRGMTGSFFTAFVGATVLLVAVSLLRKV